MLIECTKYVTQHLVIFQSHVLGFEHVLILCSNPIQALLLKIQEKIQVPPFGSPSWLRPLVVFHVAVLIQFIHVVGRNLTRKFLDQSPSVCFASLSCVDKLASDFVRA
jgi:hypothetical protein